MLVGSADPSYHNTPRQEARFTTLVGCDLHTCKHHVAVLDTDTGEVRDQVLAHAGDAVERFYPALPLPVTVGIEATATLSGSTLSFNASGIHYLSGEAAKIRAQVVRKNKTDRRDAYHLPDLLQRPDRYPTIWVPDPPTRDLRALVTHRLRLVRIRSMVKNGLYAIALNQRLTLGHSLLTRRGQARLQGPWRCPYIPPSAATTASSY